MLIHISGVPRSGKTYLGSKLQTYFGDEIIVKDLDDLLWDDYLKMKEGTDISPEDFFKNLCDDFQIYLDNFIKQFSHKPIVLIGINVFYQNETMLFKNKRELIPRIFFNLHADHSFYIDIPVEQIIRQRFNREFTEMFKKRDKLYENLLMDEKGTIESFVSELFSLKYWRDAIPIWDKIYKDKNYTFLPPDNIYEECINIVNASISPIN